MALTPDETKLKDLYTWYFLKASMPFTIDDDKNIIDVNANSSLTMILAAIFYIEYSNKLQTLKDKE